MGWCRSEVPGVTSKQNGFSRTNNGLLYCQTGIWPGRKMKILLFSHKPTSSHFQAQERTGEIVVGRCGYCCLAYGIADYIRYLGAWDIHPLSGNPNKKFNYYALIMPFDVFTRSLVIASIVTVMSILILMDMSMASWKPGWTSSQSSM